jgi:hypothetical protein
LTNYPWGASPASGRTSPNIILNIVYNKLELKLKLAQLLSKDFMILLPVTTCCARYMVKNTKKHRVAYR